MMRRFSAGPQWVREPELFKRLTRHYRPYSVMLFFWAMAWYERFLTRPARLLLIVLFVTVLFSMFMTNSPLLVLLFLMLAAAVTDGVVGLLFAPRLELCRKLPERGVCRIPFTVRYTVKNKRRFFPALDLLAEPYTENKHLDRPDGLLPFSVERHGECTAEIRFLADRRGVMEFPCAMVESTFPFAIFKHAVRKGNRENLLIHPYHYILPHLPAGTGMRKQHHTVSSAPVPGESMDFLGCRKFQTGDSVRKIHWKASAKHNTLIAKEFQQEKQSGAILLADTFLPNRIFRDMFRKDIFAPEDPELEACLAMSASIAVSLQKAGTGIHRFSCSSCWGQGNTLTILDQLAYAKKTDSDPLPLLTKSMPFFLPEAENAFLVLLRWDDAARETVSVLKRNAVPVFLILISAGPVPAGFPEKNAWHFTPDEVRQGKADLI